MSDFTAIQNTVTGLFSAMAEDSVSDFVNIGDGGIVIITSQTGFGEGLFGAGPFGGGSQTVTIDSRTTWTNITTP